MFLSVPSANDCRLKRITKCIPRRLPGPALGLGSGLRPMPGTTDPPRSDTWQRDLTEEGIEPNPGPRARTIKSFEFSFIKHGWRPAWRVLDDLSLEMQCSCFAGSEQHSR